MYYFVNEMLATSIIPFATAGSPNANRVQKKLEFIENRSHKEITATLSLVTFSSSEESISDTDVINLAETPATFVSKGEICHLEHP